MTDLIHHDPLCFRALDDAGLPQAFLDAVTVCRQPDCMCIARWNTARLCVKPRERIFLPQKQNAFACQDDLPVLKQV